MSDSTRVDNIARQAAAQLAADVDATLPEQVEQVLAADPLAQPSERVFDPISVGALIVSIASLGWTIYHDLKKDRAAAKQKQITEAERLTARLRDDYLEADRRPAKLTPEQYDRIITVVVAEIVAADGSS